MFLTKLKTALSITFLFFMLSGYTYATSSKIGIIVYDGFLTSDVTAPIEVFGAASKQAWFSNYDVVLISVTNEKTVKSEEGLTITANTTIEDVGELDVLIVPSAYDMKPTLSNKKLISFIAKQNQKGTLMSSNCSGAFLLGKAGVLDGKKATTWAGGEQELADAYPKINVQYNTNVVVDTGVVTSNGGPVSYEGAFEILRQLSSKSNAKEISELLQFNRISSKY
jgi:transcriptional regulator GlxA family with amidase domain